MKKNPYLVNLILAAELAVICLTVLLIRTYTPAAVIPHVSIPTLVLLSGSALAAEHYLSASEKREWFSTILLAGLSFTLLPYSAGVKTKLSPWMLFSVSTSVFGITALLYTAIGRRLNGQPRSGLSPIVNAFCLYLASHCFQGLI